MTDLRNTPRVVVPIAVLALVAFSVAGPAHAKRAKSQKARVEGVVSSPAGEPAADVRVHIRGGEPAVDLAATTDAEGRFGLDLEPDGTTTYSITFSGEGFAPFESDLVLDPGEKQDLQVRMVDAASDARNRAARIYNQGIEALREEDSARARNLFVEASELDPGLAEAHMALADLFLREDWLSEALVAIERYRALRPDEEQGRRLEFEIQRRLGNTDRLRELASEGGGESEESDLDSSLAAALHNEAVGLIQIGERAAGYAKFVEAVEADPNLVESLGALSRLAYDMEKYEEALGWADRLAVVAPESTVAARVRFLVFDAEDRQGEATEALEAYRKLDPSAAADLLYRRAELDFRSGRSEDARAALESILADDPDHARAHYTMGLIEAGSDTAAARRHFERFLELAPDDPEADSAREMLSYF